MVATTLGLLVLLAISPAAYAGSDGKDDGAREARPGIEKANAAFSLAFERGDAKGLAEMYTADAIAFPPDHEMINGRDAIGAFWKATRDSGVRSVTLTTIDVGRSGDIAYEVGKAALRIEPDGQPPTTALVKYVVVWKRGPDGSWKLHRDIWNSLPAQK